MQGDRDTSGASRPSPVSKLAFALYLLIAFGVPFVLVGSLFLAPEFWNWVHGRPIDYWAEFKSIQNRSGLEQWPGSSLYLWLRVAAVEPLFWTGILYAAAPAIAGLVVAAVTGAAGGLTGYGRRWRFSNGLGLGRTLGWYAGAFVLMAGCNLLAPFLVGFPAQPLAHYLSPLFPFLLLGGMFFDQGGLLEEGGWRGFALPYLHRLIDGPLKVNILLGVIWALWHIPRDFAQAAAARPDYVLNLLAPFLFGSIALGTLIAFFFYRVGGIIWIGVMIHSLSNNTAGIGWSQITASADNTTTFLWVRCALYTAILIVIWVTFGSRWGPKRDASGAVMI